MGIEGKVAKVLNSREVIINKGSSDGVETGMKFNIQEPEVDVFDPDSKVLLGRLTRSKIRVEITEVQPQFSVARTFETYQEMNPEVSRSLFAFPRPVTKVKTIRRMSDFEFREGSVYVDIGDLVIQAPQPQG